VSDDVWSDVFDSSCVLRQQHHSCTALLMSSAIHVWRDVCLCARMNEMNGMNEMNEQWS
jgi:hypothetical protein